MLTKEPTAQDRLTFLAYWEEKLDVLAEVFLHYLQNRGRSMLTVCRKHVDETFGGQKDPRMTTGSWLFVVHAWKNKKKYPGGLD